jgi:Gametolysin peptidase M11
MKYLFLIFALLLLMGAAAPNPKTEHDCTLTVTVEDGPKEAKYWHWCFDGKEQLRLQMPSTYKPGDKNLKNGTRVKVRGTHNVDQQGRPTLDLDGTDVQFLTVTPGNPAYTNRPNTLLVILVSYSNQPSPVFIPQLRDYYANMVNSVAREMSNGVMFLKGIKSPADAADFVDVTVSVASGGCDTFNINLQAAAAAKAQGFDINNYDRHVFHIPASSCAFSGVSTLGGGGGGTFVFVNGQQDISGGCRVVCHELLGHNLAGQYHSHSNTLNSVNCCTEEYGDFTDYMGSTDGVLNPWQRKVAGWFDTLKTPQSTLVTQSGDYTITALTDLGSATFKALRIPVPNDPNTELWVSYNTQIGHYGQTGKAAGVYLHSGGTSGGSSYLIAAQFDPGVVWPLGLGKTFSYPYAPIFITNKSVNATQVVINVTFTPPPPPTSTPRFTVTK